MARRFPMAVLAAVLVISACGGGSEGGETTTTGANESTSTTAAAATTLAPTTTESSGQGQSVGIGDIPQECVNIFIDYLKAIEPIVETVDWDTVTMTDFEDLGNQIDQSTAQFQAASTEAGCDNLDVQATDQESFDYLVQLAQENAPGTVPFFEMLRDFAPGTGEEVSGDCETDIAALQAIIDQGGTMQDLTFAELATVGDLTSSISANCSQDRALEFFTQSDVTDWMGGGD